MTVEALIQWLLATGALVNLVNNPLSQFGTPEQPMIGATILPNRVRPDIANEYTESDIKYMTYCAPHNGRYSPPVPQGGAMVGSYAVKLGDSNTGAKLEAQDFDSLIRMLRQVTGSAPTAEQAAQIIDWSQMNLVAPLDVRNEVDRWNVIINATLKVRGYNGLTEDIPFPNPAGHRVAVGGAWSNAGYAILDDIEAMCQMLTDKGLTPIRFITSRRIVGFMKKNTQIIGRANRLSAVGGVLTSNTAGRLTNEAVSNVLNEDGLPGIETFDSTYWSSAGVNTRYMPNTVFVIVCATPRTVEIAVENGDPILLQNTLGYVGIGTCAAQNAPGRIITQRFVADHPPHLYGTSVQVSGPVLQEAEGLAVLSGIN